MSCPSPGAAVSRDLVRISKPMYLRASLQGVVVDADPGEHCDFLPAQPGHAAVAAIGG